MAIGFGDTSGSGPTDVLSYAGVDDPDVISCAFWVWRNAAQNQQFAGPDDLSSSGWFIQNTTGRVHRIITRFSTTNSQHTFAAGPLTDGFIGEWYHVAFTHDRSAAANTPVVYVNGVAVDVNTNQEAVGTYQTAIDPMRLGNRSDGERVVNGKLAEAALWNRILTAEEIAAMALVTSLGGGQFSQPAYTPAAFPRDLFFYAPLVRGTQNLHGGAATVTGTAVQTHPRVMDAVDGHTSVSGPSAPPPVTLSNLTCDPAGSNAVAWSVETNTGSGTIYWVASLSATPPSEAQLQAGQDHEGNAAAASGTVAVSEAGLVERTASGLEPETTYYIHVWHNAPALDDSSDVLTSDGCTTEPLFGVVTLAADPVGNTTARLNGELLAMGDAYAVDVWFRWRPVDVAGHTPVLQSFNFGSTYGAFHAPPSLAFSRDGTQAAIGTATGHVLMFDYDAEADQWSQRFVIQMDSDPTTSVAFHPDGAHFAFITGGSVWVRDTDAGGAVDGNLLTSQSAGSVIRSGLAYSPDGTRLFAGLLSFWRLYDVDPSGAITTAGGSSTHGFFTSFANWTPDSQRLIAGGESYANGSLGRALVYDATGASLSDIRVLSSTSAFRAAGMSVGGDLLALTTEDRRVWLVDPGGASTETNAGLLATLDGFYQNLIDVAMDPSGLHLNVFGDEGDVYVHELAFPYNVVSVIDLSGAVRSKVALSPDGRWAAVTRRDADGSALWFQSIRDDWTLTDTQTMVYPGEFLESLSGLGRDSTYEFQARAWSYEDGFVSGAILHFTTSDVDTSFTATIRGLGSAILTFGVESSFLAFVVGGGTAHLGLTGVFDAQFLGRVTGSGIAILGLEGEIGFNTFVVGSGNAVLSLENEVDVSFEGAVVGSGEAHMNLLVTEVFTQDFVEAHRVEDMSLNRYETYVGVGTLPDTSGAPDQTDDDLPIHLNLPPDASYQIVILRRDKYGLRWDNSEVHEITLDAGGFVQPPPPPGTPLFEAHNLGNGTAEIRIQYNWGTEPEAQRADEWRVWIGVGSALDPDTEEPTLTVPIHYVFSPEAITLITDVFDAGTELFILVRNGRTSDGVESTNTTPVLVLITVLGVPAEDRRTALGDQEQQEGGST